MKNRKAFVFGAMGIVYLVLAVVVLGLLIWFGFQINEGLQAVFLFLKTWWWALALAILGLMWHKQLTAVVNAILRRVGIKV